MIMLYILILYMIHINVKHAILHNEFLLWYREV